MLRNVFRQLRSQSTLRFTEAHEWVRVEGNTATFGITDYAQQALGDVVYIEAPVVGQKVGRGEQVAAVESVKAASDIYAPVGGVVGAINEELAATPGLINTEPYAKGWVGIAFLNQVFCI